MDNLQIWLYVIIAVVYLISRAMKKSSAEAEGQEVPQPPPRRASYESVPQPSNKPKALTFEELLREITDAKTQPEPKKYVNYDDDLEDEGQDLEQVDTDYRKSDSSKMYEQAKSEAFARPSLEELTPKMAAVNYEKFKEFEEHKEVGILDEYVKELRDPQGFKKAFIMSEILNRKHF